jgi:hypothetical protein
MKKLLSLILVCSWFLVSTLASEVKVLRLPDGGIQPQSMVDEQGVLHLIYLKGDPKGSDVFYIRMNPGESTFSKPIQVNHQKGSAIAVGTIRGAHLAIGKQGRPHIAWMGGDGAARAMINDREITPMLYTRLADDGKSFEPERNIITYAGGLDGGGTLAADSKGNVYVLWHGSAPENNRGEEGRAVFMAASHDEGAHFDREKTIAPEATGACGCCGMGAFANSKGELFVIYRAALEKINRDEILLISSDKGKTFQLLNLDQWKIPTCPMSSVSLQPSVEGTLAAWETDGKVQMATLNSHPTRKPVTLSPKESLKRKHPVAIQNQKGEKLLVWTEGTGWQRGGAVLWQKFNSKGEPQGSPEKSDGLPIWGLATAATRPDGSFLIIY